MKIKSYFRRKSMKKLISESHSSYGMDRTLDAFQLTMLGIGAIIGAGIFVFIGICAGQHAGPASIISFILAGLACICVAFCYAELASAIPIAGGSYTYTYATLGEFPAFLIGGTALMAYCLAASAVAAGWSDYLQNFLFDYGIQIPAVLSKHYGSIVTLADGSTVKALIDLPALILVLSIGMLVFWGTETSAIVNTIIVIIKMTVLSVFIIIGSTKINIANWQPFIPANTGNFGEFGLSGILAGAGIILLSYPGFEIVATAAQETKNPQRALPIGIIVSLLVSIIFYVAIAAVLTGLVSYKELNVVGPMALAVNKIGIPWFMNFIKIGAIAGLTSVVLAIMFACVRILFTMTHDGLLPKKLMKIHKKHHTPYIATIFVVALMAALSCFSPIDKLVKAANFGFLVIFIIGCVAAIYLRYKQPSIHREFKCPMFPWIPIMGIILFSVILFSLSKDIFIIGGVWFIFLFFMYSIYSFNNSNCKVDGK